MPPRKFTRSKPCRRYGIAPARATIRESCKSASSELTRESTAAGEPHRRSVAVLISEASRLFLEVRCDSAHRLLPLRLPWCRPQRAYRWSSMWQIMVLQTVRSPPHIDLPIATGGPGHRPAEAGQPGKTLLMKTGGRFRRRLPGGCQQRSAFARYLLVGPGRGNTATDRLHWKRRGCRPPGAGGRSHPSTSDARGAGDSSPAEQQIRWL